MKCYSCNKLIPDDSEFCQYCGATIVDKCPSCGAELPEDSLYCLKCGQKITSSIQKQDTQEDQPTELNATDYEENAYQKARKLMHGLKASNYEKALELLSGIQEYKDAPALTEKCQDIIQELPKKKAKRKKAVIIIAASIVLVTSITLLTVLFIIPESKYSNAQQKLDNNEYDEAVFLFEDLEKYKDSPQKVLEAKYAKAENYVQNNNYDNAIQIFEELGEYEDCKEKILECRYQQLISFKNDHKYDDAIKVGGLILEQDKSYKDAVKIISDIHLEYAKVLLKEKKYDFAKSEYKKTENCDLTSEFYLKCFYEKGKHFLSQKKYVDAISEFEYPAKHNFKDSKKQLLNTKYLYIKNYAEEEFHSTQELLDGAADRAYEYATELMKVGYKDSEKIYHQLYDRSFKVVVNTKEDDNETDMSRISVLSPIYFHLTMIGGKPDEKIRVNYKIKYPDDALGKGDNDGGRFDFDWIVGSTGTNYWENGLYYDSYSWRNGDLTVTYYDEDGNELASKTVYVYY